MSEATKKPTRSTEEEGHGRLEQARKSLREMEEEIAPFIRHRKFEEHTTAGEWRDASDYERSDFFHDLRKASRRSSEQPSRPDQEKR